MKIDVDEVHDYLAKHERRELLRFVAVGSVDDGKSTLIGRLLHDTHGIYEDQLAAVERASKRRGSAGGRLDLALLTDGLKAEREQGITIDVAYRYFSTERRKFIIADTPGHVQYTRNMATGASTANVALILIDARHGVLQQSRRHAYIASLLGIPHLLVCVNKMDLLDFDEGVFEGIRRDFEGFARRMRFESVRFVPVSAVDGDNVVHRSDRTGWYDGETVLSFLENVPIGRDHDVEGFRLPVQLVLRPDASYRGYCGQIASGVVTKGEEVVLLPSRKRARVAAIDAYEGALEEAFAPMSITLRLDREVDVSRGETICHPGDEPHVRRRFTAHVVWMSERPLDPEGSYVLKHAARTVRANVEALEAKLDMDTLEEVPADGLGLNDIGKITVACNQPLYFDRYRRHRQLGAFVLIDALTNDTVGAGMIDAPLEEGSEARRRRRRQSVGADERRERLGHSAHLVCVAGGEPDDQAALALGVERALFDRGVVATVVDVPAIADGSRSPELLADIAEQCVQAGLVTILSAAPPRASDWNAILARFEEGERLLLGEDGDLPIDVTEADAAATVVAELERRGVV